MLEPRDGLLLAELQQGLPLCSRPYHEIGAVIGMTEAEVIERLARLQESGLIKRMGVIVKHRELGYRANAMVVWNIPDDRIKRLGEKISGFACVTLCYQRPRLGEWPYNLYCMIHGKDRNVVLAQLDQITVSCGLADYDREVLFSRRCFKQRGAHYRPQLQAVSAHG